MRLHTLRLAVLVTFALSQYCFAQTAREAKKDGEAPNEATELTKLSNDDLIMRLGKTSDFGVGFHPTAFVQGFVADNLEPRFTGGILGSSKPKVHPAMKELVRRGVDALPDLIEHLSNKSETGISVGSSGFAGATWHSDEYDPRYSDKNKTPKNVNTDKEQFLENEYKICVGDLCYVAVGQIVNRNLNCLRYQPSGCYVINSPVFTPELAIATKNDWQNLTKEQHKDSLAADAASDRYLVAPSAMQRLVFYYPEDAERVALSLLGRKIYDLDLVWNFVEEKLVKTEDEENWKKLVEEFEFQYGKDVSQTIPYWIHWIYWETDIAETEEFLREKKIAARILRINYPSYEISNPPAFRVADLDDQILVVGAITNLKSKRIDDAIHATFIDALPTETSSTLYDVESLAKLAVIRVKESTKKKIYADYFRRRIKEVNTRIAAIENDPSLVERLKDRIVVLESFATTAEQ